MNSVKKLLLFLTLINLLLSSCSDIFTGRTTEGVIEYEVTYPDIKEKNMMVAGLPDKATYKFKDNNSVIVLSGMMGLLQMCYIANGESKEIKQTLNLIDKKYVSTISQDQLNSINSEYVKSITEAEGTKEIIGYKCKKAKAVLTDGTEIEVYYTTDLGNDDINWGNPYRGLKGTLMEFQLKKYGITMRLSATKVVQEKVEDAVFTVPSDFKKIHIKEQDKILEELNPVND